MKQTKEVIEWFDIALRRGHKHINLYYEPNRDALCDLCKSGKIKRRYIGKVFVGYEYKRHLFNTHIGSGDCEEILCKEGKI